MACGCVETPMSITAAYGGEAWHTSISTAPVHTGGWGRPRGGADADAEVEPGTPGTGVRDPDRARLPGVRMDQLHLADGDRRGGSHRRRPGVLRHPRRVSGARRRPRAVDLHEDV